VGPWSEFKQGVDLVCPKCDERLRHMGLDYEKPSDTYVCRQCRHTFNESSVEAHCLHCGHVTPAGEITATRVYAYTPNAKTNRAVEYGRLYGLDIHSVLFEDRSRTFRRDYLIFELDREIYRARRYDSPLSLVLLKIEGLSGEEGKPDASAVAQIGTQILERVADELRDLDVVSALDDGLGAILLPETDLSPATQAAGRVTEVIAEFQSVNMEGRVSVTAAVAELKDEHQEGMEFFDYAHRVLLWALKHRSGQVVRADVWEGEVENA
jgi:GGDEF domain-containing protein